MEHSNVQHKSNITLKDIDNDTSSNTYTVSYVNFEGKTITQTYDRHNDNKKE